MYLVDTDVLSEGRKDAQANPGVRAFFAAAVRDDIALYISVLGTSKNLPFPPRGRHNADRRR